MTATQLVFIGFGEAARAFAGTPDVSSRGYDRKTDAPATREAKLADFDAAGVTAAESNAAAVAGAPLILSLVTADQALPAARQSARAIAPGALYCDMNSVAPATKRAAAEAITAAGGRYVDVAVMAPVHPQRRAVPLLISGPHAAVAQEALTAAGFTGLRLLDGPVGAASSVKMIRSVMVKGLEALTAECVLAAERAGVLDAVIASLDASWPGADWAARADYNLDRMILHGTRRAAEMEEVVTTLEALGTGSAMSRATVDVQHAIGGLGIDPRQPLAGKIAAVLGGRRREAA